MGLIRLDRAGDMRGFGSPMAGNPDEGEGQQTRWKKSVHTHWRRRLAGWCGWFNPRVVKQAKQGHGTSGSGHSEPAHPLCRPIRNVSNPANPRPRRFPPSESGRKLKGFFSAAWERGLQSARPIDVHGRQQFLNTLTSRTWKRTEVRAPLAAALPGCAFCPPAPQKCCKRLLRVCDEGGEGCSSEQTKNGRRPPLIRASGLARNRKELRWFFGLGAKDTT